MPPRDLQERTRLFANAVVRFCRTLPKTDEAQEEARQLRDTGIRRNDTLIQEARELASIFAKSVSTARKNTRRRKDFPNS